MAKVILMPGIESISGKVGKVVFKTNKKGETFMYRAERSPRKSAITAKEKAHREKFAQACAFWKSLGEVGKLSWAAMYEKELGRFNGKTYNTLRGYVIAVMMSGMSAPQAEMTNREQQNGAVNLRETCDKRAKTNGKSKRTNNKKK